MYRAPAIPVQKAEIARERFLYSVVSIPRLAAASWSSRMETK